LGLSISYDIIRQHQGEILVENVPGEGVTFTVWLPLALSEEDGDES
jgi:two-component system NtrC family sensor kinase